MDTQNFTSFEVSGLFYPTKGVGGKRYDPCVMQRRRWFGKGDSFKIWQFLVSMLDFWGVFFDFCCVFLLVLLLLLLSHPFFMLIPGVYFSCHEGVLWGV